MITAGIDVGSGAVKAVVMHTTEHEHRVLGKWTGRIRRREVAAVCEEVYERALSEAGQPTPTYVATTGEGEDFAGSSGHFYGMTTHARGALFLRPDARCVLDVGALHSRAIAVDERGRVLGYKMTSQCASGSGQFLENIARYLGVSLAEVGPLSLSAAAPEGVSSICAVLAETDVINMVSRGIATPDILRGIHDSMAGRLSRLLKALKVQGTVLMTGGLALDVGLQQALRDAAQKDLGRGSAVTIAAHEDSIYAGAIGAAIWGGFRARRLQAQEIPWTAQSSPAS